MWMVAVWNKDQGLQEVSIIMNHWIWKSLQFRQIQVMVEVSKHNRGFQDFLVRSSYLNCDAENLQTIDLDSARTVTYLSTLQFLYNWTFVMTPDIYILGSREEQPANDSWTQILELPLLLNETAFIMDNTRILHYQSSFTALSLHLQVWKEMEGIISSCHITAVCSLISFWERDGILVGK